MLISVGTRVRRDGKGVLAVSDKLVRARNERLRAARDARRWTQKELAKALEKHAWGVMKEHEFTCSVRKLQHWEAGIPPQKLAVRVLISCLGKTAAELGLEPDPEPPWCGDVASVTVLVGDEVALSQEDGVQRRQFVTTIPAVLATPALGGERPHVSTEDVAHLNEATHRLQVIDDQVGGASLPEVANRYLAQGYGLLAHAKPDRLGRTLHGAVGRLAVSVGWFCLDAGQRQQARVYMNEALRQAQIAEDPHLQAAVYYCMATEAKEQSDPRPAEVLRFARVGHQLATCAGERRAQALFGLYQGRAWVLLGEPEAAHAAIGRAWEDLGAADAASGGWFPFCTEAGALSEEAGSRALLGAYKQAEHCYEKAIDAGPGIFKRNHARHHAALADVRLDLGEVEGACEAANVALASKTSSAWIDQRLGTFAGKLARCDAPVAREFVERWRAFRATSRMT
jgi:tetratricopeptide (TPR) repeat protein/transcriptional regulator with XRE-family HTH domain